MHRFFFSELGIHNEKLPTEFTEYNDNLIRKWSILRLFFYKEILQHIIPFIQNVERESFHELIKREFSSFCLSKNCGYGMCVVENKALVLVTVRDKTQIPHICSNACCFRFFTPNARITIWNDKCADSVINGFRDVGRINFDGWLSEKEIGEHTLTFMPIFNV